LNRTPQWRIRFVFYLALIFNTKNALWSNVCPVNNDVQMLAYIISKHLFWQVNLWEICYCCILTKKIESFCVFVGYDKQAVVDLSRIYNDV
jgi:hypothetical protein